MSLSVDPFGPEALLVRFAAQGDANAFALSQALQQHIEARPPAGLLEATPGFTTLLLEFEPGSRPEPPWLAAILEGAVRDVGDVDPPVRVLEIPVVYDGPDLHELAASAGLSVAETIRLHTAPLYRVQLLGFAPGFPYLAGLDRRLHTPRRATPRLQVPAGSVAIGGEHTGIYPVATAGGWHLIGRTEAQLIDPVRAAASEAEAFLCRPGDGVRFMAIEDP